MLFIFYTAKWLLLIEKQAIQQRIKSTSLLRQQRKNMVAQISSSSLSIAQPGGGSPAMPPELQNSAYAFDS